MLYLLEKVLALCIICSKCKNEDEKIFKENESIKTLKILGSVNNIEEYEKHLIMTEENMNQEFRLKKIDETRNYLIEEINRNKLVCKEHKNVCRDLN